jgi:hypothetical protein
MTKLILMSLLVLSASSAYAMECFQLGGDDDWQRVSSTEIIASDAYGQKYQVTVSDCPELMFDEPIIVDAMDNELCSSDVLRVGGDICPIENIVKLGAKH